MRGGKALLLVLAGSLRELLDRTDFDFEKLQELKLRTEKPFFCQYDGKEYAFLEDKSVVETEKAGGPFYVVSKKEVKETLEYLSSYSLYAYEEELRQGFFTIKGGHRIGLSGRAVLENGRVYHVRNISCLNIRLAHQIPGCAESVFPYLYRDGAGDTVLNTLVFSPPGCGKTTLLRDMIRMISNGEGGHAGVSVGVADERSELGACYQGVPQNDLGMRTDVFDNCPKAEGLFLLIRSMAPRVVAADEIGGEDDIRALRYAGNCGCSVLATAHASSLEELKRKQGLSALFEEGFFDRYILLGSGEKTVGQVAGIYDGRGKGLWF